MNFLDLIERFGPPVFLPMQRVTVVAFGARLRGRVSEAVLCRGGWVYEVQYSPEPGEFRLSRWYADELEAA